MKSNECQEKIIHPNGNIELQEFWDQKCTDARYYDWTPWLIQNELNDLETFCNRVNPLFLNSVDTHSKVPSLPSNVRRQFYGRTSKMFHKAFMRYVKESKCPSQNFIVKFRYSDKNWEKKCGMGEFGRSTAICTPKKMHSTIKM